jgi:hypothetical protein
MDPLLERTAWLDAELAGCTFADVRLGKRLRTLLERLGGAVSASLPLACQDWAATKAAYRFFTNQRVSEKPILAGHLAATRSRVAAADSVILILHDTTEFTFQRQRSEAIGVTYSVNSGKDKAGRWRLSFTHKSSTDCRAECDIGEPREAAPHDHVAGRRISGPREIAAKPGDLREIVGERLCV